MVGPIHEAHLWVDRVFVRLAIEVQGGLRPAKVLADFGKPSAQAMEAIDQRYGSFQNFMSTIYGHLFENPSFVLEGQGGTWRVRLEYRISDPNYQHPQGKFYKHR
jgi:hypothetical protein